MKVELINHFGSDDMIVDVARVSYDKKAENYTDEQNKKLVKFLWNHKHTSPFRHPTLQFRITCPIYIERQLFKHQVGISVNSISGRYVDFSDTYGTIGEWRKQSQNSKQGSDGRVDNQLACKKIEKKVIDTCKQAYSMLLDLGVSKEQARTVLPLCLNTSFVWTGTMLSFMHMCSLRLKPDAQAETRQVVDAMLSAVREIPGNPFEQVLETIDSELI
jgi:thymidylate synthase (FAD)